jgi:uncharacterized repeat protein (TIGR01451 family)
LTRSSHAPLAVGSGRRCRTATSWVLQFLFYLILISSAESVAGLQGPAGQPQQKSGAHLPAIEIRTSGLHAVAAGDTLRLIVQVINHGPGRATQLVVEQPLPISTRFLAASEDGRLEDGVVTWPAIDEIPAGQVISYEVTLLSEGTSAATAPAAAIVESPDVRSPPPTREAVGPREWLTGRGA